MSGRLRDCRPERLREHGRDTRHHIVECCAVLGAVKASSLRSDAAFRGASDLDHASAQRVTLHLRDGR